MTFAQIFDEYLTRNNITNYKMATDTGISDSLIGYWRKGKRKPTLDNILVIANYLHVSIDYLLTGKERLSGEPLSVVEESIIRMYRALDDRDKVDTAEIVQLKYNRLTKSNPQPTWLL